MTRRQEEFVLSLYPGVRGFAFALFTGSHSPVDWGTKEIRGPKKNARTFRAAMRLIEVHQPAILVLENVSSQESRRWDRARRLLQLIHGHAMSQALEVHTFTRAQVRQSFSGVSVRTKHQIAQVVASELPVFDPLLPRLRRRWDSEAVSMGIFQAAALAITFYCHSNRHTEKAP